MKNDLIGFLIKLKNRMMEIILGVDRHEDLTYDQVHDVILSLGNPKNLIERSYFQYKCQKKRYCAILFKVSNFILNLCLFIPLCCFLVIKYKGHKEVVSEKTLLERAACLQDENIKDRIPNSILGKYDIIYGANNGLILSDLSRSFVFEIWRTYPFSILFVTKCALKIALYEGIIRNGNISAIIATSEDSYTSSVLTEYCRRKNILHINVMHGESYLSLSRTFFEFDECYVWDEHYVELFSQKLMAASGQFIVEQPSCLVYESKYPIKKDVTYYLQNHTKKQMEDIKKILDLMKVDYKVRPHPRYTKENYVNDIFALSHIEDFNKVSIEESIMSSEKLIAWDSTTLYQGYLNGKSIVIDDVSNPDRFEYLRYADYIMINKPGVLKLSDIIDITQQRKEQNE